MNRAIMRGVTRSVVLLVADLGSAVERGTRSGLPRGRRGAGEHVRAGRV